jgi:actin-like ATPase involved in cell morphogenesis
VTYVLGVDLGTTFSAAAVAENGRAEVLTLGTVAPAIPSVVVLREDGEVLVGEAADRRSLSEPTRTARHFKRRLGDPTPLMLGGTPYGAEALMAHLLRYIVRAASEVRGEPPAAITVTHPANYGPYKRDLLLEAVRLAGLENVRFLTEPEAAAINYAEIDRLDTGDVVAVYDFGGGTFDASVLRKTAEGFDLLGEPQGIERLGGIDFDQAVFAHVDAATAGQVSRLDTSDPAVRTAVAHLRADSRAAKESLSSDTDATIAVMLPGVHTDVRLTRSEFEAMIRPRLAETLAALERAVKSAGLEMSSLSRVLLVGGSSRIPLVQEMVRQVTGRPTAVDAHPKYAVALGAARHGTRTLATATRPVPIAAQSAAMGVYDASSAVSSTALTRALPAPAAAPAPVTIPAPRVAESPPTPWPSGAPPPLAARRVSPRMAAVGGVAALLLVGAIGVYALTSRSAPPAASPTLPAALVAPAATAPSASPADLASTFIDTVTNPAFAAKATVTGRIKLAGITVPVSGEAHIAGTDSQTALTVRAPGATERIESIDAAGKTYERTTGGPWVEQEGPAPKTIGQLFKEMNGVVDVGVETKAGRQLHHLRPRDTPKGIVDAIGLRDPSIRNATATIDVYADDRGTPVVLSFGAKWTQLAPGQSAPATATIDFDLTDIGIPQAVAPPADAWQPYRSSKWKFTIAHPFGWTLEQLADYDRFTGPLGELLLVARFNVPRGTTLAAGVAQQSEQLRKLFATRDSVKNITLDGQPARLLIYHLVTQEQRIHIVEAVTVRGSFLYLVQWYKVAGTEAADRKVFNQFLSTFAVTV